jgi:hypothetical protein
MVGGIPVKVADGDLRIEKLRVVEAVQKFKSV